MPHFPRQSPVAPTTCLRGVLFAFVALWPWQPLFADDLPALHAKYVGADKFRFSDWAGPRVDVFTYVPDSAHADSPILFVMHGVGRDPKRYRREWIHHADQGSFVLVVPGFSKRRFPGADNYNLGRLFDKSGGARRKEAWSYSAIEPVFDAVRQRIGSRRNDYAIYGHSAGAQFVHRFLLFVPDSRASIAIAANAGWYTMPSFEVPFPYGLAHSPATEESLRTALAQRLIILLGTADTDPNHRSLRRTPAALAQGDHRLARGHTFFKVASFEAERLGSTLRWQLALASDVDHDNGRMAPFAVQLLNAEGTLTGAHRTQ